MRRKGTKPEDRYHGLETLHPTTGPSRQVEIHLVGGAPHLRTYDVDGKPHLTRLARRRINRRINKTDGTARLSAEYDVPGPDGTPTGYIRIRLDHTTQDQLRGHNRPEHLRAFPEDDPVFTDVQRVLGISQEQLAERSGLHRTYIVGVERQRRNPSLASLEAIAAGLDCDPADLLRP